MFKPIGQATCLICARRRQLTSVAKSALLLYDCTTIVGAWNRLLPGTGLTASSGEKSDDDDDDDNDDGYDDDDDDDDVKNDDDNVDDHVKLR